MKGFISCLTKDDDDGAFRLRLRLSLSVVFKLV